MRLIFISLSSLLESNVVVGEISLEGLVLSEALNFGLGNKFLLRWADVTCSA